MPKMLVLQPDGGSGAAFGRMLIIVGVAKQGRGELRIRPKQFLVLIFFLFVVFLTTAMV